MGNASEFKKSVLSWLDSMSIDGIRFKMNEGADASLYTSCFALFIQDLFGCTENWSEGRKTRWSDYINGFQCQKTGYYLPPEYDGSLNSKPVLQLTCFCLSALAILKQCPGSDLTEVRKWLGDGCVTDYLDRAGVKQGAATSGNLSMLQAILLTHEYERTKSPSLLNAIEEWFDYHETYQNPGTGFWGDATVPNRFWTGYQNAFHQFVIYTYWNRPVPNHDKIIDRLLKLQNRDGHFGPLPGGGGCSDYDAADILINCGLNNGYETESVTKALKKLFFAILGSQNTDGGFCESARINLTPSQIPRSIGHVFSIFHPLLWYYRNRLLVDALTKGKSIHTHWTRKGRRWHQSDLWNTWFRCLTLAQISERLEVNHPLESMNWKFHDFIGLGFFR